MATLIQVRLATDDGALLIVAGEECGPLAVGMDVFDLAAEVESGCGAELCGPGGA